MRSGRPLGLPLMPTLKRVVRFGSRFAMAAGINRKEQEMGALRNEGYRRDKITLTPADLAATVGIALR